MSEKADHEQICDNGKNLHFSEKKLDVKNLELKHRMCLLEFGLGLIATLVEDNVNVNPMEPKSEKSFIRHNQCKKYKTAIQNIGKVLLDMENALTSAASTNEQQRIKRELITKVTPASPQLLKSSKVLSTKPTIFIDEMESGRNSLSGGLCNIQVVENSTAFTFSDSSLEVIPTLATVAEAATSEGSMECNVPLKKRKINMYETVSSH